MLINCQIVEANLGIKLDYLPNNPDIISNNFGNNSEKQGERDI